MFDFKTEFKEVNSINGIRDGLIPFALAYLAKKNNVFYIAMNDLELSQITGSYLQILKKSMFAPFHHGIVYLLTFHHLIITLLASVLKRLQTCRSN